MCILSGLYGVLRPLDLILPYRLEMGTRLKNARGGDLYAFWQEIIPERIDDPERLKAFDEEGYYFHPHLSGEKEWFFCR